MLCCGAKQARDITGPGRDAQGIFFAVDYLTSVTRSLLDSNFADGKAVSAAGKRRAGHRRRRHRQRLRRHGHPPGLRERHAAGNDALPARGPRPGNDWPEWPRVLKTDYGQQEAIAKFGFDPASTRRRSRSSTRTRPGRSAAR